MTALIRSGDHVILSAPADVDQATVQLVKDKLMELFPENGFTVLAGLHVEAVMRAEDGEPPC